MMRFLAPLATLALFGMTAFAADDAPLVLVKTIQLKGTDGKLDHLAVDVKNQRLFVANKPNNTLDIVDLKTGKLVEQIPDQGDISGVAYAADLDMVYVGNGTGVCNGFSCANYKRVFSTKAPGADNVHYHSGEKLVYAAIDDSLSVLDAKTGTIKGSIVLPGSPHGFKIDQKSGKLYVVLTKPSVIAVVDLAKSEVTNKFPLTLSDAGSPIAHDATNGLLFVGCPKKAMVVIFDAKTGKELAGVEIPGGVDDVHYDSDRNRVYASCGDGFLTVLGKTGDKFEVIAKIATPKFSRTCAYDDGKLYLGVPKQAGTDGPEVRIYDANAK